MKTATQAIQPAINPQVLAMFAVCIAMASPLRAQNNVWDGSAGSDWNNPANWSLNQVPNGSTGVEINTNSGHQPVYSSGTSVTFGEDQWLRVGQNEASGTNTSLIISNGSSIIAPNVRIGQNGTGLVTVTGTGSLLKSDVFFVVNNNGGRGGILNIANGGALDTTGALLYVGIGDPGYSGVINVTNGGSAVSGRLLLGEHEDGNGYVNVSGQNSTWIAGENDVIVGHSGRGELTLTNHGQFTVDSGYIIQLANNEGSTGTLNLDSGGVLNIGGNGGISQGGGTAHFNIGGGILNMTSNFSSAVDAVLSGGGSTIDTNAFNAVFTGNFSGTGALAKEGDGALVLAGNNTFSGPASVGEGTLQVGNGGLTGTLTANIINDSHVIFDRENDYAYNGIISGTGDFAKEGNGILTLTNFHTYTGTTLINDGTLNLLGGLVGPGGLVTVATGATLTGTGSVDRDIVVNAGGSLLGSLVYNGGVEFSDQENVGNVVTGTVTASAYQQLNIGDATGGTINATAGTAYLTSLDGATLQVGNFGALVDSLQSGTVTATGGLQVANLNGGDVTMGQLAFLSAQQGNFQGSLSGDGGLWKVGEGTLTVGLPNTFLGGTTVWGGVLQVAALGALGQVPIVVINNGRFQVLADIHIGEGTVTAQDGAVYEKDYSSGEELSNVGTFQNDNNISMEIGAGTSSGNSELEATWLGDVLSLDGLDGTSFLLVMNTTIPDWLDAEDVYIGWLDDNPISPTYNMWINAVDGNHGEAGGLAGFWDMDYLTFLSEHEGWDPDLMLGAYGTNKNTGQVWAVIDHNSEFQIVPEPSVWALLTAGLAWLLFLRKRRTGSFRGSSKANV